MSKCTAKELIAVATAEIGYREKATNAHLDTATTNAGTGNFTKYARDFDEKYPNWYNGKKNGFAWCDMFVDWCFLTAFGYTKALSVLCQPERSAGAGCTYSYAYFKAKGRVGKDPKVGAQIFFGSAENALTHTGIVTDFNAATVYTIEGNTSDMVAKRSYSRGSATIYGYGYPIYDDDTVAQTTTQGVTSRGKTASVDPAYIWKLLLSALGNAFGVAAAMGHFDAESRLNPTNLEDAYERRLGYNDQTYTDAVDSGKYAGFVRDSAGYGLAQWTWHTRKAALLTYAKSKNSSVGNVDTQIEFFLKELKESFPSVLSVLKAAKSVREASDVMLTRYECPLDQSEKVKAQRAAFGQTYYNKYAGKTVEAAAPTETPVAQGGKTYRIEYAASKEGGHANGTTYHTTDDLNFRTGAGVNKTRIKVLNKGTAVSWFGYYTTVGGVRWYLVMDATGQTGFVCSDYLAL